MLKKGMFAKYNGIEYEITVDMEGHIKVMTREQEKTDDTFVDTYQSGVYTKIVQPDELTDCVYIKYYGIMDGEKVDVLQERDGQYQVGTGSWELGSKLNIPRIDRDAWLGWVPKDQVELIEEKTSFDPYSL